MAPLSPIQMPDINRTKKPNGIDLSNFKILQTAGAPLSTNLLIHIRNKFPGVFVSQGYGCTEAGAITMFDSKKADQRRFAQQKLGSCGHPLSGLWYKVVDVETRKVLGPNHPGELLIKTKAMIHEYYKYSLSSPLDKDGWLPTGDLVYYDNDYCFYVVDRLKEVLKVKRYQIAPALIEKVVLEHPAVREVAVIGTPDSEYGDLPTAVVVLEDNSNETKAEDIKKFVDDRVDDLKKLKGGVKFIEELPLTSTGKVKRLHLKELIVNNQL